MNKLENALALVAWRAAAAGPRARAVSGQPVPRTVTQARPDGFELASHLARRGDLNVA